MPQIYLSPSLQEYNRYITGENEEQMMNRLADAMMPYLRASGITVVRNRTDQNLNQVIAESNSGNNDLHIALHSNASPESMSGQLQGTDIYYRPGSWQSRHLADLLVRGFQTIYPYPWMVNAVPTTSLAEVRRTLAPAVLIEVAYHDNWEDAQWIRDNLDNMARVIVRAITEYFGIPFVEPQPVRTGTVTSGGANLNLRSRPNTGAPILARMPDGAQVTIYGTTANGWYVVNYNGTVGYASSNYIAVS